MSKRTGIWLIGARGGLATTAVVGCRAMARRLAPRIGLTTDMPEFQHLDLVNTDDLIFGGHDVRSATLAESAAEIARDTGSIPGHWLPQLDEELREIDQRIRPGTLWNCGDMISSLADSDHSVSGGDLRGLIQQIGDDLEQFRTGNNLDRVIVVNLASTEPPIEICAEHQSLERLDSALDRNQGELTRASLLYAYAAIDSGCPYVNFTPSNAALVPALFELAERRRVPLMGSDGKTGETLVKSALAPMFRHRALRVLTWQGYNILGDRDGQVLANEENLKSKVSTKDQVIQQILGYKPHTHVGIDYVPSLNDLKTAWDFIHFEGFLGFKMSMQFTWQGCDSILAAPLVFDLVRLMDLAHRRGEVGPMRHLAAFFKHPHDVEEHDLHMQRQKLMEYVAAASPE